MHALCGGGGRTHFSSVLWGALLGCTTLGVGGDYIKFRNEAEGFQILLNQKGLKFSKNIILIVSSKTSGFASVNLTPFIMLTLGFNLLIVFLFKYLSIYHCIFASQECPIRLLHSSQSWTRIFWLADFRVTFGTPFFSE